MVGGLFDGVPEWLVFAATIAVFLLSARVGVLLGARVRARTGSSEFTELGTTVGGLLGLMGLLLAFTFGMAGERFDRRKTLVIEEANAIGTAWLRTDLIPEPQRTQARDALREYTQARLDAAALSKPDEALARSERIHVVLWSTAAASAAAAPTPPVALFVAAVNEVIDMHARRVAAALRNPIPPAIFGTLYAVAVLVLGALGYSRGLTGDRSTVATVVLSLVLAVVILLILDLDRPYEGLLTVSQQAMQDVRSMMGPR
jgi:uncharacterized protein YqgC (DUF456 family)